MSHVSFCLDSDGTQLSGNFFAPCSALTAIKVEDIISTLQSLGMIKFWRGQHVVSVTAKVIEDHLASSKSAANFAKSDCVRWAPKSVPKPTKR